MGIIMVFVNSLLRGFGNLRVFGIFFVGGCDLVIENLLF